MQSSLNLLPSLSHKIIADNPQIQEQRCRICYEESKPLITLCECSGSIAYVHQDCILDWITKKMESSEVVEIPKCQICRSTYSAKLKIGRKKICHKLLLAKIKELKMKQILISLLYIIGSIIAIVAASTAVFSIFASLLTFNIPTDGQAEKQQNGSSDGILMFAFKNFVFPLMFLKWALLHGKLRMKLVEDSKVQIVEVTLNPKLVLKH